MGGIPDRATLDLAGKVRSAGCVARLGAEAGAGALGALWAGGRDVLSFIHSQVTNEVEGLSPGEGNASARVTRQGQLVELFDLHRLPDGDHPELLMVLERHRVSPLHDDLDAVLFADQVEFREVTQDYVWLSLQGGAAPSVLDAVLPASQGPYAQCPAHAVVSVEDEGAPKGTLVLSRSLTGDAGLLVLLPAGDPATAALADRIESAALEAEMVALEGQALADVLEILRVEAGVVRMGPDSAGRKRILPETGLEQQTVSYTKGCYLGQEVIARVRTYGRLPFSLRGLTFACEEGGDDWSERTALAASLPEPGGDLILEDGRAIGQLASRTLSPTVGGPVAYAYLDKTHRTPGATLAVQLGDRVVEATISLLPFYHAPGREERVAFLYDQAVRCFAEGDGDRSLRLLEEALHLDPGFSDGYEAIGVMLGRSERFHEAIDIFKRLEEIAPSEPMVNTNLSLYFMKVGDKDTAEAEAAKAMQKSMARSAGREVDGDKLDEVLAEQKLADARRKKEMFGQVLEIDAEDGVALFGLANALSVLGDHAEALALYERAAEAERDNSAVYLAHGKALEELGRGSEAEGVYRAGMEVASRKGDLMPLREMEHRVLLISGAGAAPE